MERPQQCAFKGCPGRPAVAILFVLRLRLGDKIFDTAAVAAPACEGHGNAVDGWIRREKDQPRPNVIGACIQSDLMDQTLMVVPLPEASSPGAIQKIITPGG